MKEKILALIAQVRAGLQARLGSIKTFYARNKIFVLGGLAGLSILLVFWARLGFRVSVSEFQAAPSPAQLTISCSGSSAILTWAVPDGANSNTIQELRPGASWQNIFTDATLTATRFVDSSLVSGTQWRHKSGASVASNTVTCSTAPTSTAPTSSLPAPVTLSVQCSSAGNLLSWTAPGAGSNSSSILRSVDGATNVFIREQIPAGVLSHLDTDVSAGRSYRYVYKNHPQVSSNAVTCPASGAGVVSTPTPTPTPLATPTPSPSPTLAPLACAPVTQTVAVGAPARLVASGGLGQYQFTGPQGTVQDGTASATLVSQIPGSFQVVVRSGTQSATCGVVVAPVPTQQPTAPPAISMRVEGANVSTGSLHTSAVSLRPSNVVEVRTVIRSDSAIASGVALQALLPQGLSYMQDSTRVNGVKVPSNTIASTGIPLGSLGAGQELVVVFWAQSLYGSTVADAYGEVRVIARASGAPERAGNLQVVFLRASSPTSGPAVVPTGPADGILLALVISASVTLLYASYTHTRMYVSRQARAVGRRHDKPDFLS